MPSGEVILGLAPALSVADVLEFGPLRLSPIGSCDSVELRAVAAQYATQRGAHPEHQAVVTCSKSLGPMVPTIWSLFVFACVSCGRRREYSGAGTSFPENFHLLAVSPNRGKLSFETGHSIGFGRAEHVPLRWPVDRYAILGARDWDLRIEHACRAMAAGPLQEPALATAKAAGVAADLACAALERRAQRVENVAAPARAFILLASAFEALHYKGSSEEGSHRDVYSRVDRLNLLGRSDLAERLACTLRRGRAPLLTPDPPGPSTESITRPTFAVAQLFYLRNVYAHGRTAAMGDAALPAELNECSVLHAATLILALLIGDDLVGALSLTDMPFGASWHHADMLDALAEAIVPTDRQAESS